MCRIKGKCEGPSLKKQQRKVEKEIIKVKKINLGKFPVKKQLRAQHLLSQILRGPFATAPPKS